jgi:hypothetical protein
VFGRAVNNHGDNKLVGGGFYISECFLILRHEKTAGFHVSAIEMAVRIFAVFFYF